MRLDVRISNVAFVLTVTAFAFVMMSCGGGGVRMLSRLADPALANQSSVINYFPDGQWTKDPEYVWLLSCPPAVVDQVVSTYRPCDLSDTKFITGMVAEKDPSFHGTNSSVVFRKKGKVSSNYLVRVSSNKVYFVALTF